MAELLKMLQDGVVNLNMARLIVQEMLGGAGESEMMTPMQVRFRL